MDLFTLEADLAAASAPMLVATERAISISLGCAAPRRLFGQLSKLGFPTLPRSLTTTVKTFRKFKISFLKSCDSILVF